MSDLTGKPFASLGDINRILGCAANNSTPQRTTTVAGVNPIKITCDDLYIRKNLTIGGYVTTRLVITNGSASNTALGFLNGSIGTGFFSPGPDRICISIAGADVACFSALGVGLTHIHSPSGIIDFGGASLTNISGIIANPRAYEIVGSHVPTVGAVSANTLAIPLVPTAGLSGVWELTTKVVYALGGSGGAINGVFTFRVRAYITTGGAGIPVVSAQYDSTKYESPALLGTAVVMTPVAGAINVVATGIAGQTIIWQTKSEIVKVEL